MSHETKLDCLWMTSPCRSFMTETYTQRWILFIFLLGYLFKDTSRLKTRKWHDTKNKVKPNRVKTKRLMCLWTSEWHSVSRDWTARCSLNIQSEEEIETYWHENLGALRQSRGWTVSMCLCACGRCCACERCASSPGARSVLKQYPCVWGWP